MAKKPKIGIPNIKGLGPFKKELEALEEALNKDLFPPIPIPKITNPIHELQMEMREIALEQEARADRAEAEKKEAERRGARWRLAFFALALVGAVAAGIAIIEFGQEGAVTEQATVQRDD